MQPQKLTESQGKRLLRQIFSQGKRIFNTQDVTMAASTEKIPHNQISKILSNLAKQGWILRLHRGLYVNNEFLSEQPHIHPFIIASFLKSSAISHWSALLHHGLTEQIPQIVMASTTHKVVTPSMRTKHPSKTKHYWEIAGTYYEYITVQQKHFFGMEKIWMDEYSQILITDKERTLLDVFVYSKIFGGMGEALGVLENSLASIDIEKLIDYALRYQKKSLIKRLGWALEYFGVSAKSLESLLKVSIQYYCRLDPSKPAIGVCDKRWMIQDNLNKGE